MESNSVQEFQEFFSRYYPERINPTLRKYFDTAEEYYKLKDRMRYIHEDLTWLREAAQGKKRDTGKNEC